MTLPPTNLRPVIAAHLRQRLDAFREGFRHNLAVLGPPGSGKTHQLRELRAQLPSTILVIECPLYRESCRSFLQRFCYTIVRAGLPALQTDGPGSSDAPQPSLAKLLQRAEPALPNTVAAIRHVDTLISRRAHGEAFTRALDAIPILMGERQQPCVLILDEFLFLESLGLTHAFHELGKRVMTWPSTLFILASSSVYRARLILRERLQLLFGQFELVSLERLDPEGAAAWAQQSLRGLRGVKMVSQFLIRWLGAYPWYLGVFLERLRERVALGKNRELTEALFLATAWDLLSSPTGTLHQWCSGRMEALGSGRLAARATEALTQIAEGARTTTEIGARIGRGGLSEALQLLVERDLAERNGMCWVVTDPILRCWLCIVLAPQRTGTQPERTEAHHRLDTYLRGLWSRWMEATTRSFSEQVVELFRQFADDTVSLDAKTGRLPKFDVIRSQPPAAPGPEAYVVADGQGKRWCATVHTASLDEAALASFDAFCRTQTPKPSRKVVVVNAPLDDHARLLAKAANMWVWEPDDLATLRGLYGQA